jgi:hypothetical protein
MRAATRHYMFVRFRQSQDRLHVSLVSTRRTDGKVKQEHVASFGSVEMPLTGAGRVAFWRSAHQRLAKLSNRIGDGEEKIVGEIAARIPIFTDDEFQSVRASNAEADAQFCQTLHDAHADDVEGIKPLAAHLAAKIAEHQKSAKAAAAAGDKAKDKRERALKGEIVGFGAPPMSQKKIEKLIGRKLLRNGRIAVAVHELGLQGEVIDEAVKMAMGSLNVATRRVLKRHGFKINR